MTRYVDEWGHPLGYCNSCGEEAEMDDTCCDNGEVVPYDDDSTAGGQLDPEAVDA